MKAVKTLRSALGDTQQEFATRLGLSIATVVRYELTQPPKLDGLKALFKASVVGGMTRSAAVFRRAIFEELGGMRHGPWKYFRETLMGILFADEDNEFLETELLWIGALLRLLRSSSMQSRLARNVVVSVLFKEMDGFLEQIETSAGIAQRVRVRRMLESGSAEWVSQRVDVHDSDVALLDCLRGLWLDGTEVGEHAYMSLDSWEQFIEEQRQEIKRYPE